MKEKVLNKIIERGSRIWGVETTQLNEDTLFADMNAKSTHYSQITTYLEDEFDIEVPYMGFKRCKSLGEAADYVVSLLDE
ncbi:acyl carrier protein [Herbinix luporum]|uniref:acyl carrier protein n=1 Tax=Herbinix luporum TaxID=1679721 RepID=UPI0023F05219|nr:acyl carrier protein [Herbinix luporum]